MDKTLQQDLAALGLDDATESTPAVRSGRGQKRLELLLKMSGLSGIPANSDLGKLLRKRVDVYMSMHNGALPDKMVERLVQMAVETEILKDAAFTWMSKLRPPKDALDPQKAMTHQKIYATAAGAYRNYAQLLMSIMKLLAGDGDANETEQDIEGRMKELSRVP